MMKHKAYNSCEEQVANSTTKEVSNFIPLTPGQQSLKRLKEMPYTKPDGKAFVMGWRKRLNLK